MDRHTFNRHLTKLTTMLTYRRPRSSKTESEFVDRFIRPLGVTEDKYGNLIKVVGENPTVLWSSHTDTVHVGDGRQLVLYDKAEGRLKTDKSSKSSCLGADDTAGIWLKLEMIKAGVPGLYVFHYGEEEGCIGSKAIAKHTPELLDGIKAAIAFDRKGRSDIITHQAGGRTCSDAFAESLALQLPGYGKDPTGVYTDTNSYKSIVPECTNVSIGYFDAHTPDESLDPVHLIMLRETMVKFDANQLVIARDPEQVEYSYGDWSNHFPKFGGPFGSSKRRTSATSIEELVWEYPEEIAALLESLGYDVDSLKAEIDATATHYGNARRA